MNKIYINGKTYMTPKDYASLMNRSLKTVYTWIDQKKVDSELILEKKLICLK